MLTPSSSRLGVQGVQGVQVLFVYCACTTLSARAKHCIRTSAVVIFSELLLLGQVLLFVVAAPCSACYLTRSNVAAAAAYVAGLASVQHCQARPGGTNGLWADSNLNSLCTP
jgi:hypothetical protein